MTDEDFERAKYLLYEEKVRKASEKTYKSEFFKYREYRGNGYELDHKLSIKEGYELGVPIELMADRANLQMILKQSNREKSSKSSITYEELIEEISNREYELEDFSN